MLFTNAPIFADSDKFMFFLPVVARENSVESRCSTRPASGGVVSGEMGNGGGTLEGEGGGD